MHERWRPTRLGSVVAAAAVATACAPRSDDGDYLERVETAPVAVTQVRHEADVADLLSRYAVSVAPRGAAARRSPGVLWEGGHVVTVRRDLDGAAEVLLPSARRMRATVVGRDTVTGLVVLRPHGSPPAAPRIAHDVPRAGVWAVAIAEDRQGVARTTVAVVSSFGLRRLASGDGGTRHAGVVELDDAVGPPGSPAMTRDGAIIGIAIATRGDRALLLPSATVDAIVGALASGRRPTHRPLGVQPAVVTPRLAMELRLRTPYGVLVRRVAAGSAAARAGLRAGDVIVAIAGRPVRTLADLLRAEERAAARASVRIVRDGRDVTVHVDG